MLDWFISVNGLLREIRRKATDALSQIENSAPEAAKLVNGYLKADYQSLYRLWDDQGFSVNELGNLGRHLHFGDSHDYRDIIDRDLPFIESMADKHARKETPASIKVGFEELLHPIIYEHAFQHYLNGHYREAVLNSIMVIFDLIREKTKLDLDGSALVNEAYSLERGKLAFSEIESESGRNDQKGFMQILSGAYLGIRNPKAHSLVHDLDAEKAAQYLVFSSLLARRVYESRHL